MLRIETFSPHDNELLIVLSGWIRREHLAELDRLVADAHRSNRRFAFDLRDVGLVDREVVDFLASGAASGARLGRCPPYLRAWLRLVGRKSRRRHGPP